MRLKSIALLVVAMLVVIGSVAATTHMGAEEPGPPAEIGYWCEPKPYGGVLDARLDIGYGRPELPGSSELSPFRSLTIEEAFPLMPKICALITEKAERLGIESVPVAFALQERPRSAALWCDRI